MEKSFYHFLKPISTELTRILEDLERAIYQSPRFMITHSRTLIEAILEKIMIYENMKNNSYLTILERIQILDKDGLLTEDVRHALHEIRKLGNIAAHDIREFRFSESLITWERIYIVVKWYVEVYGSHKIKVPPYEDPIMKPDTYDLDELRIRMERFEEILQKSIKEEAPSPVTAKKLTQLNDTSISFDTNETIDGNENNEVTMIDYEPGLTPVRTIRFKNKQLDIPHFLRDAFLLPQRFPESVRYIRRLNSEQEARIMSELPVTLDLLHNKVTRYNESHTEIFFNELELFIEEEIRRKKLSEKRPGELFLYYQGEEIIVTETFGELEISNDNFPGAPNLIKQLHEDGIKKILDLPKEFVIIGKYQGVGPGRVSNFFEQLKELQQETITSKVLIES